MARKAAPGLLPTWGNPGQTGANQGKPDLKAPFPVPFEPVNLKEASPSARARQLNCWPVLLDREAAVS